MKSVSKRVLEAFQRWGEAGGKKRAEGLSRSKRQAISRHAAEVRWRKQTSDMLSMPSVRLKNGAWDNPIYLEEVLSYGTLREWRALRQKISDYPFGAEAQALEKVLMATDMYGATSLWKGILSYLQGKSS